MKCKKHHTYCSPVLVIPSEHGDYICSGISKKPSKYKKDTVWLCLDGNGSWNNKYKIEMTKEEAQIISACLSLACADDRTQKKGKKNVE